MSSGSPRPFTSYGGTLRDATCAMRPPHPADFSSTVLHCCTCMPSNSVFWMYRMVCISCLSDIPAGQDLISFGYKGSSCYDPWVDSKAIPHTHSMDPSHYKDVVTSRGYKYHYYFSPPRDEKLCILFVHGFPNTSREWRLVAPHFEAKGYGVVVPDMLGYRGTDKPTDWREYRHSLLNKDLVDILDAEGIKQAVAVGHDWLVSLFPSLSVSKLRVLGPSGARMSSPGYRTFIQNVSSHTPHYAFPMPYQILTLTWISSWQRRRRR